MKKNPRQFQILGILLLLCSLAALWLVWVRVAQEKTHKLVCPVMSNEDLAQLSEASGEPLEKWYRSLAEAGLKSVLLTPTQEEPQLVRQIEDAGLSVVQVGGPAKGDSYFFALHYDESGGDASFPGIPSTVESLPLPELLRTLKDHNSLLVLVENEAQTGMLVPDGWDPDSYSGGIAKCFWLNRRCRNSAEKLGYAGLEETENILFRAVVDRGMEFLWLAPVSNSSGVMVTHRIEYAAMLRSLGSRLESAGWSYGQPSGYEPYSPPLLLLLPTGMAVLLAGLLLICCLLPLPSWAVWSLFGICVLENLLGFLHFRQLQISALCLCSAICVPCLALLLLCFLLKRSSAGEYLPGRALWYCLLCVGTDLLGGLLIAALQSSRAYLLVLVLFRGVKLSQGAVYVFSIACFGWHYVRHFRKNDHSLGNRKRSFRVFLLGTSLAILAIGVGVIYLLRTGDNMMRVSVVEQRLRNWLEHIFLFRPRTKEMLLAWPAMGLSFFFAKRKIPAMSALCGAVSGIGFASLVNTFCHSRAHFLVSLIRSGVGLIIGLALLLFLLGLIRLVIPPRRTGDTYDNQHHCTNL